jgi:hypothetical protein
VCIIVSIILKSFSANHKVRGLTGVISSHLISLHLVVLLCRLTGVINAHSISPHLVMQHATMQTNWSH